MTQGSAVHHTLCVNVHLSQKTAAVGTLQPRRGLDERFVSRVFPLFKCHTREAAEFLPQLYLHRLALGDLELALFRRLKGAELPPARVCRRAVYRWRAAEHEHPTAARRLTPDSQGILIDKSKRPGVERWGALSAPEDVRTISPALFPCGHLCRDSAIGQVEW